MRCRFSAELKLEQLYDSWSGLARSQDKVLRHRALDVDTVKRNDQAVTHFGFTLIDVCARVTSLHRCIVMHKQIPALENNAVNHNRASKIGHCFLFLAH